MNHEIHGKHERLIFKDESYVIQGAVFEVYKKRGVGFVEPVYQECLGHEFALRKIPFKSQVDLSIHYKNIRFINKFFIFSQS